MRTINCTFRSLARFLVFAGIAASAIPCAAAKPNVLFIAVDDLVPALGCYGDPLALTPQMDSLASQGTVFRRSYTPWPVCGPARAALTTSLTPEETGVIGFKPIRAVLPQVITLPQHFRNQGYETAATGKFHDPRTVGVITNVNTATVDGDLTDDAPSWSIPYVHAADGYNPPGNPATDTTDQPNSAYGDFSILTNGLALLDRLATNNKPFFLAVGFKKPHLPFVAPKQCWDRYNSNSFPLATFTNMPLGASTYTVNMLGDNDELLGYEPYATTGLPTPGQQRNLIHGYYACVSLIDDFIGELRAKLAAKDDPLNPGKKLSETTIIVLWGDHGFHLGDHGRWAKHSNLERAAFCPLIIFDPRAPTSGAQSFSPVNAMDVYPTLCELAALPIPEQPLNAGQSTGRPLRGRSLVPILQNPAASVHAGAMTLFAINGGYGYAYRTERFRYIEWVNSSSVVTARELYDYVADPLETVNLVSDPAYAAIVYQLSRSMRAETTGRGASRLAGSAAIPATGAEINLGAGLLPGLRIAKTGASEMLLQWPWANGVTYNVLKNTDLSGANWPATATSLVGGSTQLADAGAQGFYRVQLGSNTPPVFTADPILKPSATTSEAYSNSLAGSAVDADAGDMLTFTKLAGPDWLAVANNGNLSGTPVGTNLGAGYFTVQVADSHGATSTAELQISVVEPVPPIMGITNTFPVTDDTFAKESNQTLDAGSRPVLELRKAGASTFSRVAYLKFNLTGLGTNINSARLFLHSNNETDVVNALAVADTSWTQSSLNWSNRPPTGALIGAAQAVSNAWFSISVTGYITNNGLYAIALDEQGNTYSDLDSADAGFSPYLEITQP
jgi:arylsulfatase A-like enzyme